MRKLLLATAATLLWAGAAAAADLPRRSAPVVVAPAPAFTWTGAYFGVNAGYAFGDSRREFDSYAIPFGAFDGLGVGAGGTAGTLVLSNPERNRDGFTGGAQTGFNYQFSNGLVIGYETDIQYLGFGRERASEGTRAYNVTAVGAGAGPGVTVGSTLPLSTATATFLAEDRRSAVDYFSTLRGRVGFAFDRTLVYGTGGFAYGTGETRSLTGRRDEDFYGYTVGGGLEFAFTPTISAKIEGLYVNLDEPRRDFVCCVIRNTGTVTSVPAASLDRHQDNDFLVVRAGLNVRLGERGFFGLLGL